MSKPTAFTPDEAKARMPDVPGWALSDDGRAISREWQVKGFLTAQGLAMLAGAVGEARNHHPDIAYGWGRCQVTFTSHDAGGLTGRDFDCAARINAVLD
ncbi:MAG: 4a-hydroxytetrahydrobiopterin dehydratase [Paracoccus sp. (in: a-proteobacteria)]|uniref:4a-hydroxytetrahydrobiopterin dehydratase n=1 Tax=Paracoccus sp. TaxID=267 RepID=UPI0026E0B1B8|nr:4a-hydroxytetrahydrobiopterin dehydratase [Paracoccus sp. (in: a-proteobacteria)]MDO5613088.1 4a-hydroxytetrahydrobiopterin dehydratase [Paracoccus sp. (in: a-proteobacteria)]